MIDGRLADGTGGLRSGDVSAEPEHRAARRAGADGLEAMHAGRGVGPLVGGTLTQLLASFGTPFEFRPPAGHVLFLDEVSERPYRLHRMLMQCG